MKYLIINQIIYTECVTKRYLNIIKINKKIIYINIASYFIFYYLLLSYLLFLFFIKDNIL